MPFEYLYRLVEHVPFHERQFRAERVVAQTTSREAMDAAKRLLGGWPAKRIDQTTNVHEASQP